LFVDLDHTDAGRQWYVGLPYRLDTTPGRVERAAPLFGEHNHEVLSRVLGLSAERIAELDAAGVISSEPARRG
jgi:crotonobetainyl-CoA:carnitine CoA-transferase CaiB-like acyl-CoA transferase